MPKRINPKKRHYRVEGIVPNFGEIRKYCWAISPKQARWLIARRLEDQSTNPNFRPYLGDCEVTDITDNKTWVP
ncbi:MAG: hypothetical protein A2806_04065 [Candidatus Terrybacteria bacterium RIFCSPHIGHO2_01_FULL_48_17]|uniref:Uncharacterized protein n=1 Tax=Candidatus Terrybacteria bacterium RIFCSPHIGHO2_01_FULL_48_17 TaxID=1802362 RepID=A0A1G2PKJ1_9BACT|nr:MAG: hypothetical protein A2806_04065 [Candidatus Terrybacteria bacterium RIFCSPHIGHO2_01_FULL_48_17]OHA53749.1 MAG: hypothetical protein A3A30_05270 [Candidatus Terrybacteria bacterium RIFCSPLOWO2_01_FULL_48_14]